MSLKLNKKINIAFLCSSIFLFTGCLEDLLSSLCDKLASNNSVITVFQGNPANYSQQFAKVTYINNDESSSISFSQCDNKFEFPNGERKENQGTSPQNITFVNVLDEAADAFFFENGVAKTDSMQVEISFYDSCEDLNADQNANSSFLGSVGSLTWESAVEMPEEEIPLLGECEITGQSTVVTVAEI